MGLRYLLVAAVASVCLLGLTPPTAAAEGSFATVVGGLDNPRDLAFGANGRLYVAEAGSGGPNCIPGGPEGDTCPGFTSGLSVVDVAAGDAHRVVSGLASVSGQGGFAATGLDGISFLGGTLYGIMAGASDEIPDGVFSAELTAGLKAQAGRLLQLYPSGGWKVVADVGHTDFEWTADHQELVPDQFPEANPYGVVAVPRAEWVVDAASNTIDRVRPNGSVTIEAFIPNPPVSDAVPTCIDRGPDGAFYVGQLTGVGNLPGSASIWRFAPTETPSLTQWATGLTTVTGCGFGPGGTFYATEFSTLGLENSAPGTGSVVRVAPHSTSHVTVADGLSFPGGFAAGPDGSLYVSNWSIAPATSGLGSVVRITP